MTQPRLRTVADNTRVRLPTERTPLSPREERLFQEWLKKMGVTDSDDPRSFYDYRGAWKGGDKSEVNPVDGQPHWPDTYKQHGHPTFSVESQFSRGKGDGGTWEGETFTPSSVSRKLKSLLSGR